MLLDQREFFLITIIVLTWLGVLTFFVYRSITHYRKLLKGSKDTDLASILEKIINAQNLGKKQTEEILTRLEKLDKDGRLHIQKMGLVRFNPFSETGGDQSFALALLDENSSGIIISSLHSRDNTRIYAKPIEKGKPIGYDISKEEKEAITKAENGKI